MCRNCGALVGAGERACTMCDARVGATAPITASATGGARAPRYDRETMRFARAILTRPVTFTFIFLFANIFLYLLMYLSGGANGEVLLAYGAKRNDLIRDVGEWWRLVAPVFLHVQVPGLGPMHLLVNMYGLWQLGPYVERLYGSAKFVFFWIVTGIAGFIASYYSVQPGMEANAIGRFLFKSYDVAGAGASGALFGLVGVLIVFGLKFRHELPEGFRRAFGAGMLPMVAINIFIGYLGRGLIDNAGHMGGLAAGMLLALFVGYKRPGERGPVAIVWHAAQIALLLLVVASFFQVWRHFDAQPPSLDNAAQRLFSGRGGAADVTAYINALNAGQGAFFAALKGDVEAAERAAAQLDGVPALDKQADQLRAELKQLLLRARDLAPITKKGRVTRKEQQQVQQLLADFQAWNERSDQWVKTDGRNYGIFVQEDAPEQK